MPRFVPECRAVGKGLAADAFAHLGLCDCRPSHRFMVAQVLPELFAPTDNPRMAIGGRAVSAGSRGVQLAAVKVAVAKLALNKI